MKYHPCTCCFLLVWFGTTKLKIGALGCIFLIAVIFQFEDFANHHAFELLAKYGTTHLVFNDDIQVNMWIYVLVRLLCSFLWGYVNYFLGAGYRICSSSWTSCCFKISRRSFGWPYFLILGCWRGNIHSSFSLFCTLMRLKMSCFFGWAVVVWTSYPHHTRN